VKAILDLTRMIRGSGWALSTAAALRRARKDELTPHNDDLRREFLSKRDSMSRGEQGR
jgi:hypothetical protein